MTDIKRHLPEILKLIKRQLPLTINAGQQHLDEQNRLNLHQLITALLPASYGVTSGQVINSGGQTSLPLDIILYDKTIGVTPDYNYARGCPVEQVLAVFDITLYLTQPSLNHALQCIQSVKQLRPTSKITVDRGGAIPKQLFPLGIIFFQHLQSYAFDSDEEIGKPLGDMLHQFTNNNRPDYIFLLSHNLAYRNPILDRQPLDEYTIGFTREPLLKRPRICYICKERFLRQHFFYQHLCGRCGDINYNKRRQTADLKGRIALITGARLKIGYAVALRLLRAGATVIATSRFPHDAAKRYAQEADFAIWSHRLHIYGLDLRYLPSLENFISDLYQNYPQLDILINNAAQTVRRPPAFYAHLLPFEALPLTQLPPELQPLLNASQTSKIAALAASSEIALFGGDLVGELAPSVTKQLPLSVALSQIPLVPGDEQHDYNLFPPGEYDQHQQQLDRRTENSWTAQLTELAVPEIIEVQMVNAIAPTLLISQLKKLMQQSLAAHKFIINVSAVEGQFAQTKNGQHPHTNMAKAALNMLTYTSAAEYANCGIYMNSVDPGWISEQAPLSDIISERLPIDEEDAAARICDLVFADLNEKQPNYGKIFKDYKLTTW